MDRDLLADIVMDPEWLQTLAGRLAEKVEVAANGCILWRGARAPSYGHIRAGRGHRTMIPTHRLAYAIKHGRSPGALHVCHQCDTPACVNAEHLFLGSPAVNAADKMAKGRQARQGGRGLRVVEIRGAVALVPLTKGLVATIDAADAEAVGAHVWTAMTAKNGRPVALRMWWERGKPRRVQMHTFLVGQKGLQVKHLNGDTLDNRRENLLLCAHSRWANHEAEYAKRPETERAERLARRAHKDAVADAKKATTSSSPSHSLPPR